MDTNKAFMRDLRELLNKYRYSLDDNMRFSFGICKEKIGGETKILLTEVNWKKL